MGKLKEVLILKHFLSTNILINTISLFVCSSIDSASLKEYTALFLNFD